MRCDHCPVAATLHCPGEDAVRLCQLTDSTLPDYRAGYCSSIQSHARPRREEADRLSVNNALDLVRRMRACPYHSRDADCGCSGARCALRHGAIASYSECFDCIRRYERKPEEGPHDDQSRART